MESAADRQRIRLLLARLRELELTLPLPHARGIHEVAKQAVVDAIHALGHRLDDTAYLRPARAVAVVPVARCG